VLYPLVRVRVDKMVVTCICGTENELSTKDELNTEVMLSCKGCSRDLAVVLVASVEDGDTRWIN
jgi:hypothetical protein